jgi:RNA 2',3'-cyclic 3'-phosphodiesterase
MRTFIEIELPAQARACIQKRQDAVRRYLAERASASRFRWTPIDNIHLTLRFLGETTESQQQLLASGLKTVAAEWRPLSLSIGHVGGFPTIERPRVVWLGVQGDLDALRAVQSLVERLAQEAGFEAEPRAYSPHLTIARIKRDCSQRDLRTAGAYAQ